MASKTRTKKATKPVTKKATPKPTQKRKSSQIEVMHQVRDHFGQDQLIIMAEQDSTVPGFVSTQSLALDWVVGNGGVPQSRIVDASGDEGVGKSTFADHLMSEVQRQGGHCYLWDTENARDDRYQEKIGISRKSAGQIVSHTMEDGLEFMIKLVAWHRENDPDRIGIIAWDTPAGTPTRAEVDPDKKSERFGPAKIIRAYLRQLNQELQQSKWILCVINQTYMGQSVSGQTFKAVYGGGGIPFYSSVRLTFSHRSPFWRTATDKEMHLPPIGQTVYVKCVKNRVSTPWRSKQVAIMFGQGISNTWEVNEVLKASGMIKSGSWNSFDPDGMPEAAAIYPASWQGGFLKLEDICKEHPDLWPLLIRAYKAVSHE